MAYRNTLATEARKDARRRTILGAATGLFGSYGYHSTTVPMIVAESNSSVGSFYAHFRNKEDVFAAVLETIRQKVAEVINQANASQPDLCRRFLPPSNRCSSSWPKTPKTRAF